MENYWGTIKEVLSSIAGVLVAVTPLALGFMAFYQWKMNRKMTKVDQKFDKVDGKIDTVEANTNGLVKHLIASKDAEIKTTGELGKAEGKAEATAKAKIEIDELNKKASPER